MEKQNAEEEAWKHEESKKEASEASQSCISGAGTKTVEYRPCTVNKRWSNYHPELIQKDLYIYPYRYYMYMWRERERERREILSLCFVVLDGSAKIWCSL